MMTLPNEGRRLARILMIAFITAQLGSLVARADIVYNIDVTITSADPTLNAAQSDTVSGTITTDNTIGAIQTSDILSWNLKLIDNLNPAFDFTLTPLNSLVDYDTGNDLKGNGTSLSFNFSSPGEFLIQVNPGLDSGYHYFCFSATTTDCAAGETITPEYFYTDAVVATGASEPVGTHPLGPIPTPEPSSVILLASVMLAVMFAVRKRVATGH
jgi:hypothetical protein